MSAYVGSRHAEIEQLILDAMYALMLRDLLEQLRKAQRAA